MREYPFDRRIFALVETYWLDPYTQDGIFGELDKLGYSRRQIADQFQSLKTWAVDDLVIRALKDGEDGRVDSPALAAMQISTSRIVFEHARELCSDDDPKRREIGVEILTRIPGETFHAEATELIRHMAEEEESPFVLDVLAYAYLHLRLENREVYLERASKSARIETRRAAAINLGGLDSDSAIEQLIMLSSDEDNEVRSWATFGLGNMTALDTPALRDALFARLNDVHRECRYEAILGLSIRRDIRVIPELQYALEQHDVWIMMLEAAKELGHEALYPVLTNIVIDDDGSGHEELIAAIESCSPK